MPALPRIAIIGTVGVPARYGGFETLAGALVDAAAARGQADALTVYCSAPQTPTPRPTRHLGAHLRYIRLRANGMQSILYDAIALITAARSGTDTILLLGVSGAIALPLVKRISGARLIVHPDGLEWQRAKWTGLAAKFLKWSEQRAVTLADQVISDSTDISHHLRDTYGVTAAEITYGGDQALLVPPADLSDLTLPNDYALAILRVEPENNVDTILTAFAAQPDQPLVIVGNWTASAHGRALRRRYASVAHLRLLDPIYDQSRLRALRAGARVYVHGASAGGTNPALVEAMHAGRPIVAFDCTFNRTTTHGHAAYFRDADQLRALIPTVRGAQGAAQGIRLGAIARRRYRWADITAAYFDLLGLPPVDRTKASPPAQAQL